MPIEVDGSLPEGDHIEEAIQWIIEDEVKTIPFLAPAQQTPACIKNLQDSTPYNNKLRTLRSRSSMGTPLKFEIYPFFEDLSNIFEEITSFHNNIYLVEGNVFEDFSFDWAQMRKMVVEELYHSV